MSYIVSIYDLIGLSTHITECGYGQTWSVSAWALAVLGATSCCCWGCVWATVATVAVAVPPGIKMSWGASGALRERLTYTKMYRAFNTNFTPGSFTENYWTHCMTHSEIHLPLSRWISTQQHWLVESCSCGRGGWAMGAGISHRPCCRCGA